jgi:hypothetical protein
VRTFIQSVDGRDVATLASPFELLPGCHVGETAPHWAGTKARFIYFPDLAGAHIFPIRMRPSSRWKCRRRIPPGISLGDGKLRPIRGG